MVQRIFLAIYLALSGFFTWLFYIRFWRWRDCIDAAKSSCLTPDGENLTSGGAMWSVPAMLFSLLALRALVRIRNCAE